ncbi:CAP domain-containing protein [Cohnella sp. GbtcB17]|uniref:CAP domain-containing protein n=1 Tax=Cohnella sp. GbtcB17 TaxID=2824762 RepID=UPI001C2FA3E5|nr:CAP domain-containing protein [Cohnella sp. GbtcB17]
MKNNRIGQLAVSGALLLSLAVPFGASANAATTTQTTRTYTYNIDASQLQQYLGSFDWQSLLSQLNGGTFGGQTPSNPTSTTPTAPTATPTAPAKPTTVPSATPVPAKPTPAPAVTPTPAPTATPAPATAPSAPASTGATVQKSGFAAQVVDLVNQERAKAGLSALKTDAKLTTVADAKAKDMYNNNYFDHNSPTYGSPFDMMKQFGVTYSYAGENIAMGQQSPAEVMTAWMNSPGHKANILNANFKSIGVAYFNGEWVQEFTG